MVTPARKMTQSPKTQTSCSFIVLRWYFVLPVTDFFRNYVDWLTKCVVPIRDIYISIFPRQSLRGGDVRSSQYSIRVSLLTDQYSSLWLAGLTTSALESGLEEEVAKYEHRQRVEGLRMIAPPQRNCTTTRQVLKWRAKPIQTGEWMSDEWRWGGIWNQQIRVRCLLRRLILQSQQLKLRVKKVRRIVFSCKCKQVLTMHWYCLVGLVQLLLCLDLDGISGEWVSQGGFFYFLLICASFLVSLHSMSI